MVDLFTVGAGTPFEVNVYDERATRQWALEVVPRLRPVPTCIILHQTGAHTAPATVKLQRDALDQRNREGYRGIPFHFVVFRGPRYRIWYLTDTGWDIPDQLFPWGAVHIAAWGDYNRQLAPHALAYRIERLCYALCEEWHGAVPIYLHSALTGGHCPGTTLRRFFEARGLLTTPQRE